MGERQDLKTQATAFADDLTRLVRSLSPQCDPFTATFLEGSDRFTVRQHPKEGVGLAVSGVPLLALKAEFQCRLDSANTFLTIQSSSFAVHAGKSASGQPIFRYHYEREPRSVPSSHLHVHAHRDSFTYVMARTGESTSRAKRRRDSDVVPSIQDIHFPLGGHRFRPTLEDVLEMLIDEFGVDHPPEAIHTIRDERVRWRQTQTRSAVRDDPESAREVLRELGYAVEWTREGSEPSMRRDRLESR